MKFNTAIFYDLENLLKGYNFSRQTINNLSLSEITNNVKNIINDGHIAIQRAYANWSDPRLLSLRSEIIDLGIEPIQVLGFARDVRKNAVDIQLAIDAIDLAHVRPALENFAIISGDGGFAALAKKLHEYGKMVIGAAYQNATSKAFKALCDHYFWIADPEQDEAMPYQSNVATNLQQGISLADPRNQRLAERINKCDSRELEVQKVKAAEILRWYAQDPQCRLDLTHDGLQLNVVREGLKLLIVNLQTSRFGFPKFIEFLQYVCSDLPVCVGRNANAQPALLLRDQHSKAFEILPNLDKVQTDSYAFYKNILSTHMPIFRLPVARELAAIIDWLCQKAPASITLDSLLELGNRELHGSLATESIKNGILSLISANIFQRDPENVSISEQVLTLLPEAHDRDTIYSLLHQEVQKKLLEYVDEINPETLKLIFE